MNPIGLYVHVPFCLKKCPYCDFYSIKFDDALAERYTQTIITEMFTYDHIKADTLYFGGGTPVLLGAPRLKRIIDAAKKQFSLEGEFTVEANPCSIDKQTLLELKQAGFNRVSFGVQSGVDKELHSLGRAHTKMQALEAVKGAKEAGFTNISVDLMIGIPHQTPQTLLSSLEFIKQLDVPHVSAYILKIEQGTRFYEDNTAALCPDEDSVCDLYLNTIEFLNSIGVEQYEISNFAKRGFESKHNLKYWRCEEYLGFGASAHSYYKGKRYLHPRDIEGYLSSNGNNYQISDKQAGGFEEYAMLRLRLSEGIDLSLLDKRFCFDKEKILRRAKPLEQSGLLRINGEIIFLTPKGFLVSNAIIASLIS
jgi:oxygen-independent coproporphyrinogen-3 oxidase